eukprot:3799895-Pyramimonas_sp.AAC.3
MSVSSPVPRRAANPRPERPSKSHMASRWQHFARHFERRGMPWIYSGTAVQWHSGTVVQWYIDVVNTRDRPRVMRRRMVDHGRPW